MGAGVIALNGRTASISNALPRRARGDRVRPRSSATNQDLINRNMETTQTAKLNKNLEFWWRKLVHRQQPPATPLQVDPLAVIVIVLPITIAIVSSPSRLTQIRKSQTKRRSILALGRCRSSHHHYVSRQQSLKNILIIRHAVRCCSR